MPCVWHVCVCVSSSVRVAEMFQGPPTTQADECLSLSESSSSFRFVSFSFSRYLSVSFFLYRFSHSPTPPETPVRLAANHSPPPLASTREPTTEQKGKRKPGRKPGTSPWKLVWKTFSLFGRQYCTMSVLVQHGRLAQPWAQPATFDGRAKKKRAKFCF